MPDPLLSWAPFFYSFGPSLFVIKILADWLRVRLYFPLTPDQRASLQSTLKKSRSARGNEVERYEKMRYQELRNQIAHSRLAHSRGAMDFADEIADVIYANKAEKRYHIHHFVFGIPLLFLSWGLFVYGEAWWGLIIAGVIAALFLSELKELVTQQWEQ